MADCNPVTGRRVHGLMFRAALLVIAACAPRAKPAPEPPDPPVAQIPHVKRPPLTAPSRPEIDVASIVPDPSDELRWPLPGMVHPVLEPQFPIAPVFAMPGVGWHDLCARGVQNRTAPSIDRDLVAYLRAWCHVANRDQDLAVEELGRLRATSLPKHAAAIRTDIANAVADAGHGDQAQKILARAMIDDTAVYDLVAATYAEVGSLDDAALFNDLALEAHGAPKLHCHRLARRIVLEGAESAVASFAQLDALASSMPRAAPPDPACVALDALVSCWAQPATSCGPYFAANHVDTRYAALLAAYYNWPPVWAAADRWRAVATTAIDALPLHGADALAAIALEQAVRVSPCAAGPLQQLSDAAKKVRAEPTHDPRLDPVLDRVIHHAMTLCVTPSP